MERPDNGRRAQSDQEQTAKRHPSRSDRMNTSEPGEHADQNNRRRSGHFRQGPPCLRLCDLCGGKAERKDQPCQQGID